jgi:hypothetical protein
MLCALTARRLKPGAWDEFRRAWEPQERPEQFVRVYHLRKLDDPDEVVSFGFFDGTIEELRDVQERLDYAGQRERIAPHVERVEVDGIYDVVEELTPESSQVA